MNTLLDAIAQLSLDKQQHTWSHQGPWRLECHGDPARGTARVYSHDLIPAHTYLGDIEGTRCYAWEHEPSPTVFWFDEDLIIDCSTAPRCLLAFLREGFYEGLPCNCELVAFPDPDSPEYLHVGMKTLYTIYPGEELVFHRTYMM